MPFNNHDYSDEFYEVLYGLGVYAQPDGSLGVSDKLPRCHIEEQYIVSFESFAECITYLESELNGEITNFISVWDSLKSELNELVIDKPNHQSKIDDDLVFSFINAMLSTADNYNELEDVTETLIEAKKNIFYMDDSFRERLGYFCVLLQSMDSEILGENQRLLTLKYIKDSNQDSQIKNMLKFAYYAPYGRNEGVGYRGRNNPMSPLRGFDYVQDRVMDGTELHDYPNGSDNTGHASEKFIGRDGYNKFKKHPELLRDTTLKLKTSPLGYMSRERRRKLKAKQKKQNKYSVGPTGRIRQDLVTDPTKYEWWEPNKNPYMWADREDNGVYPTWSSYR